MKVSCVGGHIPVQLRVIHVHSTILGMQIYGDLQKTQQEKVHVVLPLLNFFVGHQGLCLRCVAVIDKLCTTQEVFILTLGPLTRGFFLPLVIFGISGFESSSFAPGANFFFPPVAVLDFLWILSIRLSFGESSKSEVERSSLSSSATTKSGSELELLT